MRKLLKRTLPRDFQAREDKNRRKKAKIFFPGKGNAPR